jgi:hypothetical protein
MISPEVRAQIRRYFYAEHCEFPASVRDFD